MIATLYVKKVWSYNPTQYKFITLEKAMHDYELYCVAVMKSNQSKPYSSGMKTFKQWLRSEI